MDKKNKNPNNDGDLIMVEGGSLPSCSELAPLDIKTFSMAVYPVTFAIWQEVRDWAIKNNYELNAGEGVGPRHPVTNVNWYDCIKWCNAKSEKEGLPPVYLAKGCIYRDGEFGKNGSKTVEVDEKSVGFRLPKESEWEWAARGGLKSKGYEYSGSNKLEKVGWFEENSGGSTHPVGEKTANELGFFDMNGNVEEWCWDLYDKNNHCLRGGGWKGWDITFSLEFRDVCNPPHIGRKDLGFRICTSISK